MSKSTNRRKSVAIALAVLGVAGLSLASAAQLNLTGTASVQSGMLAVNADCQPSAKAITVAFSAPVPYLAPTGTTYASKTVNIANIDAACLTAGHKYKLALLDGTNAVIAGDVETALTTASLSITIPTVTGVIQDNAIKTVALTIYS